MGLGGLDFVLVSCKNGCLGAGGKDDGATLVINSWDSSGLGGVSGARFHSALEKGHVQNHPCQSTYLVQVTPAFTT
jgi:hypothetical protein